MQKSMFRAAALFNALVFLGWASAFAQQVQSRPQGPGGSAEGTLTVTATVVSSTGLVIGPDGQLRVIVANAADPRDSASHAPEASAKSAGPVLGQRPDAKPQPEKPNPALHQEPARCAQKLHFTTDLH